MELISKIIHKGRIWTKRILPDFILDAVRFPSKYIRSRKRAENRRTSTPIPLRSLIDDLKKAGITPGDIVMVHSSLSKIGNVVGGPETVIRSFTNLITTEGTLIMPGYNSAMQFVKDMKQGKLLDLRNSPSAVGKITEQFRTWANTFRSSHPFSSSCAWGKNAEYVTADHASNPYICHFSSPVGRLVELKGKVVGIGISIAQGLGVAHYLEDTWDGFPFEVHLPPFEATYIDNAGKTVKRQIYCFDPKVSRTRIDYPEGAWICEKLTAHFIRKGILKQFRYGNADSWLMNAYELYLELKRLAAKGVTMYLTEKQLTERNRDIKNW